MFEFSPISFPGFYRPQTKFTKVMFLRLPVILFTGRVSRPRLRGEVAGSARGVSRPRPMGGPGPRPRGRGCSGPGSEKLGVCPGGGCPGSGPWGSVQAQAQGEGGVQAKGVCVS